MENTRGYKIYKGLQSPLVFKGFKGKFIYLGVAVILGSFLLAVILINLVDYVTGFLAMAVVLILGLLKLALEQKKGLHNKKRENGIYIVNPKYIFEKKDKSEKKGI